MTLRQKYTIDFIPGTVAKRIPVSQYDDGSRRLTFELFSRGVSITIPQTATVTIEGTKPDGRSFEEECSYTGNSAWVDITRSMTAVEGDVLCQLKVTDNDTVLGTANFILQVEKAPVPIDADFTPSEDPESVEHKIEVIDDRLDEIEEDLGDLQESVVKSVNGETPDANGNVVLTLPQVNPAVYIYYDAITNLPGIGDSYSVPISGILSITAPHTFKAGDILIEAGTGAIATVTADTVASSRVTVEGQLYLGF